MLCRNKPNSLVDFSAQLINSDSLQNHPIQLPRLCWSYAVLAEYI